VAVRIPYLILYIKKKYYLHSVCFFEMIGILKSGFTRRDYEMKCTCINPDCSKTFEVPDGGSCVKACSPKCKSDWEEVWAKAGDSFHFPQLHDISVDTAATTKVVSA